MSPPAEFWPSPLISKRSLGDMDSSSPSIVRSGEKEVAGLPHEDSATQERKMASKDKSNKDFILIDLTDEAPLQPVLHSAIASVPASISGILIDFTDEALLQPVLQAGLNTASTPAPAPAPDILIDLTNDAPLQPGLKTPIASTPTPAQPPRPKPWKWANNIIESKKKRTASEASSTTTTTTTTNAPPQKRPRLFNLSSRLGSIHKPILLPLEPEKPQPGHHAAILSYTKREFLANQKNRKPEEFVYRGVYALLDCVGRPVGFPPRVRRVIEREQRNWKVVGVSERVYDASFEESMVNGGRGRVGERGFSSTGGSRRLRMGVGKKQQADVGETASVMESTGENVLGTIAMTDEDVDGQEIESTTKAAGEDVETTTIAAAGRENAAMNVISQVETPAVDAVDAEGIITKPPTDDNLQEMTSTQKVLSSCQLLEKILLECHGDEAFETMLNAQRVNRIFEKVVRRSRGLRLMLFPGDRRVLRMGGVVYV